MKIAILGAGNGGSAVAADLSLGGHKVTLIKTTPQLRSPHFDHLMATGGRITLWEKGDFRETHIAHVTTDLEQLAEAELVIVYIQTNYHEALIQRMLAHLRPGQIVLLNPGYLSTAYFLKHGMPAGLTVVEAESSFIDCRIMEPGVIKAGFRNVRNPLGVYPLARLEATKAKLSQVGFPFTYLSSVVEAALHNPNLIVHTVGAIMSIPRIEKTGGDYCMYHEVFTPSVWKLLEALDGEKMNVLEKLGFERMSYAQACRFRNSADLSLHAKAVFEAYAAMPTRAKGPVTVDSRYITEDVPQGLVLLETLAESLSVPTPICTALIDIAGAALGRNFRPEGRTLDNLGRDNVRLILSESRMA